MSIAMKQSLVKLAVTLSALLLVAMSLGQSSWTLTESRTNLSITYQQEFYLTGTPGQWKRAPFTDKSRCRQVSGPSVAPWTSYFSNLFDNSWESDTWYFMPSSGELLGEVIVSDAWTGTRSGLDGWTHSGTGEFKLRDLAWIIYSTEK